MTDFLERILFPKQKRLKQEIISLTEDLKNFLQKQDIQNIKDDVEQGELELAFDTLCVQLFEWDASLSNESYEKIEHLGKEIGLTEDNWNFLKSLVKNN